MGLWREKIRSSPWVQMGLWLGAAILVAFPSQLLLGRSLLPVDVLAQGYLPWAKLAGSFSVRNHFESDIINLVLQYKMLGAEALFRPYWNAWSMGGVPDYANPYASHFSIFSPLFAVFSPSSGFLVLVILHLTIAALGFYQLLRLQSVPTRWARMGALAFAFCGPMLTFSLRWWVPAAMGWCCWALWAQRRRSGWTPVFIALAITDGFVQTSVYVGIVTLVSALIDEQSTFRARVSVWIRDWMWAVTISAIALLPQLEFLIQDFEKGGSRVAHSGFQKDLFERVLSIPFLLGAWLPEALGTVRTLDFTKLIRTNLQDFAPFFGTVTVALAALGVSSRIWKIRPHARLWWALLIFGLGLPVLTPLDRVLYFRFLVVGILGAVGLAVHFGAALEEDSSRVRSSKVRVTGGILLFLGGLLGTGLMLWAWSQKSWSGYEARFVAAVLERAKSAGGIFPVRFPEWMELRANLWLESWRGMGEGVWSLGFTAVVGLILSGTVLRGLASRSRHAFTAGMILLLFQISVFAHRWFPSADLRVQPVPTSNNREPWVDGLRASLGSGRLLVDGNDPSRREIFPNNVGSLLKVPTLNGFDGLKPFSVLQLTRGPKDFRGLGVTAVMTYADRPALPGLRRTLLTPEVALDLLPDALGPARVVSGFEWADSPVAALERAWDLGFEAPSVVLEGEPELRSGLGITSNPGAVGSARLVGRSRAGLEVSASSDRPALLVLAETWYPGWRAQVNGEERPVWRAQRGLRAVAIPAGESRVVWSFDPLSYRIGFWISIVSAIGYCGYLFRRRAQSKGARA